MFLKLAFFVCFVSCCLGQLNVGDQCTSKDGEAGVCKTAILCSDAVKAVKKVGFHTLKRCGFLDLEEIVCCIESGFGDRTADPTTEPAPPSTPSIETGRPFRPGAFPASRPGSQANESPSLIVGGNAAKAPAPAAAPKPLRIVERECQRIKQMLPPPLDSYILGGSDAFLGEFPHMVQIGYIDVSTDKDKEKGLEFLCGGTLVSEHYVMSAAHCFSTRGLRTRQPALVRVGVISLDGNTYNPKTDYNISKIVTHPQFNKHSYDIALIKLARPVPVTENAHPGCLYTRHDLPLQAIVTGWGVSNYATRVYSPTLLKAVLTITSKEKCAKDYSTARLKQGIEDNMLCAGDESGKDACQGDSGGPLQALTEKDGHYRIIGIVSFGVSCGTKIPGVYVRVSSHLDWIESIVWPEATFAAAL